MSLAYRGYPSRAAPEVHTVERSIWVYRHPVIIRLCHWINAFCLFLLIMSGLQIFNAHPALYWGMTSDFDHPAAAIVSTDDVPAKGITKIGSHRFETTGFLGISSNAAGEATARAFPSWLTVPGHQDLATGRRWHFLFAWLLVINGAIYIIYGLVTRQLAYRLLPSGDQIRDVGKTLKEHLTLQFPQGEEAKRYNLLQKLTYLVVVGLMLPVQVLTGLTMSPGMDAAFPFLLTLFGGRQSARTIHFLIMNGLVLFIFIHVAMVLVSGFWNNIRSMLSGWFVISRKPVEDRQP